MWDFFCRSKLKKYKILGEFGNILVVNDKKTLEKKVLKILHKNYYNLNFDLLSSVNHKNIIKIFSRFKEGQNIYIEMEYGGKEDLFDYMISKVPFSRLNETKDLTKQILSGVNCLHNIGITHRDIKPENFVVSMVRDKLIVKLIDFDYASTEEKMFKKCGTIYYIAPEILDNNIKYYNSKCDLWSVGVIVYLFLYGKFPFNGKNDEELYNNILNHYICLDIDENSSNFLLGLLNRNINMRLSANLALSHNWLAIE